MLAGRWVFLVETDRAGLFEQRLGKTLQEWTNNGRYLGAWLSSTWGFTFDEFTYDGDHRVLNLGPVQIAWWLSDAPPGLLRRALRRVLPSRVIP